MQTILVTGGCGFIGSHTLVDLIQHGYNVISIDNNSRSTEKLLAGVFEITGIQVGNYPIDLCDPVATREVFRKNQIDGIIHFAAYKSVDESVKEPLLYYRNNFISLINLLDFTREFNIPSFVFSSSCSVYGDVNIMPVTETTELAEPKSPYGNTKKVGEEIIRDFAKSSNTKFILLRYFNPVGAHPSGLIGEIPFGPPSNLIPAITQFAARKIPALNVYGSEYNTRDGSCIRDFIHVCDIAAAHTLALKHLSSSGSDSPSYVIYNLGTGNGVSVLEAIKAFENVTGMKLNYQLTSAREGDVVEIYANNEKARQYLGWEPVFTIEEMMKTAWDWEMSK
jgi:UDP-glucose 4-epimerase